MTLGQGCPFLPSGPRRAGLTGWVLSASAVALTMSGLAALAMSALPAGESQGEAPVPVLMLSAAATLAALSDPAPETAAAPPDRPEAAPDAEEAPNAPLAEEAAARPDPMAARDTPDIDSTPQADQSLSPAPATLAKATAPPKPKREPRGSPEPAPKAKAEPLPKEQGKKDKAKPKETETTPAAPSTKQKEAAASAGSGKTAVAAYGASVMKKIRKTKKAKAPARGSVVVGFSIADNGGLASVEVLRSSGSPDLDQVALDHIRRAAPFPAPPQDTGRQFSFEFVSRI